MGPPSPWGGLRRRALRNSLRRILSSDRVSVAFPPLVLLPRMLRNRRKSSKRSRARKLRLRTRRKTRLGRPQPGSRLFRKRPPSTLMILLLTPPPESAWTSIPASQCAISLMANRQKIQFLEPSNPTNGLRKAKRRRRPQTGGAVLFPPKKPNLPPEARRRRIRPHRGCRAGKIGRSEWLDGLRKLNTKTKITLMCTSPINNLIRPHLFILLICKSPTEFVCASRFPPNYRAFPLWPTPVYIADM